MFLLNPFVFSQTQSVFVLDPAKVKLLLHFDGNFNDTATTEIYTIAYTLSLHDALPIFTIDIDQVGDGTAKGLKLTLIGTRA